MKCSKCGAELKEGARFCSKCGAKVEAAVVAKTPEKIPERTPERISEKAVQPAQTSQAAAPESGEKKKPFLAVLLILAFLAAAAATGVVVWQFKDKLFNGGGSENIGPWGKDAEEEESEEEDSEKEDPEEGKSKENEEGKLKENETGESESGEGSREETTESGEETEEAALTTEEAAAEEKPHRYEIVRKDCTWTEAFGDAIDRGGYLVHFDTPEEYELVKEQLLSDGSADKLKLWIGGARSADAREYHWANTDGTFSGEILNSGPYAWAWMENEPSFRDESIRQNEYYMNMFYYKSEKRWVWNDVPNDIIAVVSSYRGQVGYICEYDE